MLDGGLGGIARIGDRNYVPMGTEMFSEDGVVWLAYLASLN